MVVIGPFECYGRLLVGTNRPVEMSKKLHQFQLIWWTNLSWCRVKGGNIRRVMGVHTVTSRCRLETNTISCNVILQNVEGGNGGGAQPACPPCRDRSPLATAAVPAPSKQKQNSFGFIFSMGGFIFWFIRDLRSVSPSESLPWRSIQWRARFKSGLFCFYSLFPKFKRFDWEIEREKGVRSRS